MKTNAKAEDVNALSYYGLGVEFLDLMDIIIPTGLISFPG